MTQQCRSTPGTPAPEVVRFLFRVEWWLQCISIV